MVVLVFPLAERCDGIGKQPLFKERFLQPDVRIGPVRPLPHIDPRQSVFARMQVVNIELRRNPQLVIHRLEPRASPEQIKTQPETLTQRHLIALTEKPIVIRTRRTLPARHRHAAKFSQRHRRPGKVQKLVASMNRIVALELIAIERIVPMLGGIHCIEFPVFIPLPARKPDAPSIRNRIVQSRLSRHYETR